MSVTGPACAEVKAPPQTTVTTAALADRTDADLVAAHQAGVVGAAEVLLRRHRPVVERICRAKLRDPDAVEDAVQEALLICLRALDRFQGGELFDRYAAVVAVSVCRSSSRRGLLHHVCLDDAPGDRLVERSPSTEERCLDALVLERILAELSPADSALLRAHHEHDRPLQELAEAHGVTVTAAKVRLHRARRRARAVAERHGLLGVLPVLLGVLGWRRASTTRRGLRPEWAATAVVVPLVAAPLLLTGPVTVRSAEAGGPAAPSSAAETSAPAPHGPVALRVPPGAPATSPAPADSGSGGPGTPATGPDAAVRFEPVAVPVVQRTLSPRPPDQSADHSVSVPHPTGEGDLAVVEFYDEPAADAVCGAAPSEVC